MYPHPFFLRRDMVLPEKVLPRRVHDVRRDDIGSLGEGADSLPFTLTRLQKLPVRDSNPRLHPYTHYRRMLPGQLGEPAMKSA